jgi:hypothetical protein
VVTEESRVNDELGESVAAQVSRLARPHEASKYRLHVEEVGKITSLLLGLSGRLARAENALMGLPHHHTERVSVILLQAYYTTFHFYSVVLCVCVHTRHMPHCWMLVGFCMSSENMSSFVSGLLL